MLRVLRSPDPADGQGKDKPKGSNDPAPDPPAAPQDGPPASPAAVKRTPLKTPRELELEKKLAVVEDKLSAFEGWQKEVNDWLEEFDKPVSVLIGKAKDNLKLSRKGFLHEVAKDLGLEE